ncbi:MAG: hypothetical protein LBC18_09375 [Opitutaceae bacterium]|jgi:hypothetical protein|nr:hypothetical protein [Opitutaceae bacterium]
MNKKNRRAARLLLSLCAAGLARADAATLETSACFEMTKAPATGIPIYILKGSPDGHQQVLYYTQDMMSRDGRHLWFAHVTNPGTPEARKALGVVDFEKDTKTLFPEAAFEGESPYVDADTGCVYYCGPGSLAKGETFPVYVLEPRPGARARVVVAIPRFEEGRPRQVVTHFTMNASRTALGFDSGHYPKSEKTYYGTIALDGSPAKVWGTFGRRMDHAQMSPARDDVMLIAQDGFVREGAGDRVKIANRMWLAYADGRQEPLFPGKQGVAHYHEWWDPGGEYIWFVDTQGASTAGRPGTATVRLRDRSVLLVWPGAVGHSHSSANGRYLVGDHKTGRWTRQTADVRVSAYDAKTKRSHEITGGMPPPRWFYHTHPHPQFDCGDKYILFTCTLAGYTSVGAVRSADVFGRP